MVAAGRICGVAQSLLGELEQLGSAAVQVQGRAVQVRSEGLCVDCLTWAWIHANAAMLLDNTCIHVRYVLPMYDERTC